MDHRHRHAVPTTIPVLDMTGKVVGEVYQSATSVAASKLLGGSAVRYVKDPGLGFVWQQYQPAGWSLLDRSV